MKINIIKDVIVALKGFLMGAANVVPGVSGGTMALLTGIYEKVINALNSLMTAEPYKLLLKGRFREFWKAIDGEFLLALAIGVLVSIFSLAKLMEHVLAHYPILTWAFFFGLILASAYYMLRDVKDWKGRDVLITLAGVALGLLICTLSPTQTTDDLWFIFICGAIAICTMILPGISGSFILVIFGKYDYIMSAISELNIPVLAVFALGCVVGILAFAKLLHWLLAHYERQTMLVLVGFVIGSLVKVWPWNDMSAAAKAQALREGLPAPAGDLGGKALELTGGIDLQIGGAILWCLIGIALIVLIQSLSTKKKLD